MRGIIQVDTQLAMGLGHVAQDKHLEEEEYDYDYDYNAVSTTWTT